ncbi:MAG: aryl-sulfate sulfotransferase [Candidatus Methylomirabilia bacterium]
MAQVEQNKIRRLMKSGVTAHNPDKAWSGYTLFTPQYGDGTIYLIDMNGRPVHTWNMPHKPGLYGYLSGEGLLVYNAATSPLHDLFVGWDNFKGGRLLAADWRGNILWTVDNPEHHHDGRLLRNGNVLLMCLRELPLDFVPRVRGGRPGTELSGGRMYCDYFQEVTTKGEVVWEWDAKDHLDPETDQICPFDRREEWTHGNTLVELEDGNLMFSFRHTSTVGLIDRRTGEIMWKIGPPPLAQQHDCRPLANGNVLIFDNGVHRLDHPMNWSRVIEVNPRTNEIVWEYRDPTPFNFYSPFISGAQRLPNGNTLICEGCFGRIFEVTRERELVWEYVSPHMFMGVRAGLNNWIFRALRYSEEEVERARATAR